MDRFLVEGHRSRGRRAPAWSVPEGTEPPPIGRAAGDVRAARVRCAELLAGAVRAELLRRRAALTEPYAKAIALAAAHSYLCSGPSDSDERERTPVADRVLFHVALVAHAIPTEEYGQPPRELVRRAVETLALRRVAPLDPLRTPRDMATAAYAPARIVGLRFGLTDAEARAEARADLEWIEDRPSFSSSSAPPGYGRCVKLIGFRIERAARSLGADRGRVLLPTYYRPLLEALDPEDRYALESFETLLAPPHDAVVGFLRGCAFVRTFRAVLAGLWREGAPLDEEHVAAILGCRKEALVLFDAFRRGPRDGADALAKSGLGKEDARWMRGRAARRELDAGEAINAYTDMIEYRLELSGRCPFLPSQEFGHILRRLAEAGVGVPRVRGLCTTIAGIEAERMRAAPPPDASDFRLRQAWRRRVYCDLVPRLVVPQTAAARDRRRGRGAAAPERAPGPNPARAPGALESIGAMRVEVAARIERAREAARATEALVRAARAGCEATEAEACALEARLARERLGRGRCGACGDGLGDDPFVACASLRHASRHARCPPGPGGGGCWRYGGEEEDPGAGI